MEKKRGLSFVHPFDDPDVIAGQGTIAQEILQQHQAPIDAIFVAIGGGGLIAGIGEYVKAVRPETKIIGVQAADSDAMRQSLKAGRRVRERRVDVVGDARPCRAIDAARHERLARREEVLRHGIAGATLVHARGELGGVR